MNPDLVESVLACKRIPSLPAVALKVLELTQDKNVRIQAIAETISNDPALAGKVLRTVNSSFYSLRKPCSTINQAIVMLGLSAVKTLALGFSLVSSVAETADREFDYPSYWRRSLISSVAAKCVARTAGIGQEEETFLGALLQDIGMVALHRTLGRSYVQIIASTMGDHRQLSKFELAELEMTHADIGAMLAQRWKLPPELCMPIKFHERPSAAPQENLKLCQAVALGGIAADVLESSEPAVALKKFYARAQEWLAINNARADEIMKAVTQGAREIAYLLKVDIGSVPNASEIVASATAQLSAITLPVGAEEGENPNSGVLDSVTGLPGRMVFSRNIVAGVEVARSGAKIFSVALVRCDQYDAAASQGPHMADALMKSLAEVVNKAITPSGGLVCRFDDSRLAIVLPDNDRNACTKRLEAMRTEFAGKPLAIAPPGFKPMAIPATISIGSATYDAIVQARVSDADTLLDVIQRALTAASQGAGSQLRVYAPRSAA